MATTKVKHSSRKLAIIAMEEQCQKLVQQCNASKSKELKEYYKKRVGENMEMQRALELAENEDIHIQFTDAT